MFKDFFVNMSILVASFAVFGHLFKRVRLEKNTYFLNKLVWGIGFGCLGFTLMIFSIRVNDLVIADLRHLATVLAATFGGGIPAIISALIIALGRIIFLGVNQAAINAAFGMVAIGLICAFISKLNWSKFIKLNIMNLVGLLVISTTLFINLQDWNILKHILYYHYSISLISGVICYLALQYIFNLESSVTESEDELRLIIENASDLISIHDSDGTYTYVSPAVNEILGYQDTEMIGEDAYHFIHKEDHASTAEKHKELLEIGTAKSTYRIRRKDGSYAWLETTLKVQKESKTHKIKIIGVSRNISDRKEAEQRLKEANELLFKHSNIDSLTGIPNRRFFDQMFQEEWLKLTEKNKPLSIILFDIDFFKLFNDKYGHLEGDKCLREIATACKEVLLPGGESQILARFGGEEFIILLPDTEEIEAFRIAEIAREKIQTLAIPHCKSVVGNVVTSSFGVATLYPKENQDAISLIDMADQALYQAKNSGKNKVCQFEKHKRIV